MKMAKNRAVSRQERPRSAVLGWLLSRDVKFFLDKQDGRTYPPHFISECPIPRGCNESALSPVI
jgi:hypothetical protein